MSCTKFEIVRPFASSRSRTSSRQSTIIATLSLPDSAYNVRLKKKKRTLTAPFVRGSRDLMPRSYRRRPLSPCSRDRARHRASKTPLINPSRGWLGGEGGVHSYHRAIRARSRRMRGECELKSRTCGDHLLPGLASGLSHEPARCPPGRLRETSGEND